tara:strand:- start:1486 stop:2013 length:528 start_codon:yes stop_codon:yes gene_type:complete
MLSKNFHNYKCLNCQTLLDLERKYLDEKRVNTLSLYCPSCHGHFKVYPSVKYDKALKYVFNLVFGTIALVIILSEMKHEYHPDIKYVGMLTFLNYLLALPFLFFLSCINILIRTNEVPGYRYEEVLEWKDQDSTQLETGNETHNKFKKATEVMSLLFFILFFAYLGWSSFSNTPF